MAMLLGVAATAAAKDITIAMGNFEPYYIEHKNTGIFADIITAAFRYIPNHNPKYIFGHSNKALWASFDSGRVDAVSNVFDSIPIKGCRSDPVFRFKDVAVSLKRSNLRIASTADLSGKSMVSFQGAKAFFGDTFSDNVTSAYTEVGKPELQVRMLFAGRADVSVGDVFIFLQAAANIEGELIPASAFQFHDIFPEIYSRMAFRDEGICQQFNRALEQVRQSGEYEKIYAAYLNKLGYR